MSPAGYSGRQEAGSAGFTLFEILIVMVVMTMSIAAISTLYRSPSAGTQVKSAALLAASRLRDLRSSAMSSGRERVATIDVGERVIRFSDGRAPVALDKSITVAVTGADSERRSPLMAGVRFFPNGSSTGATIDLKSERQAYEVRINWLTGRVSTAAIE
jgi:general secretion pathway protein H